MCIWFLVYTLGKCKCKYMCIVFIYIHVNPQKHIHLYDFTHNVKPLKQCKQINEHNTQYHMQYHISFFLLSFSWFKTRDVEMELVQQRKKRKGERGQMVRMSQTKRKVGEREKRVRCGGINLLHNFFHCGLVSSPMFLLFV